MEMRAFLVFAAAFTPVAAIGAEYQLAWSRSYNSDSSTYSVDSALGVAGTPEGGAVVVGYEDRRSLAEGFNILVRKFDSSGRQIWEDSYNNGSDSDDRGKDVAVAASGAAVAAGYTADSTTISAGWIRKYDSEGTEKWTAVFNKSGTAETIFEGVAINEGSQEIYLAGACRLCSTCWDGLLAKYSGSGTLVWSLTYNGPVKGNDKFLDVAVDGDGNVLVTGFSAVGKDPSNNYDYDILVVKYSSAGSQIWQKTYGSETAADFFTDYGYGITTDEANDVYVVGTLGFSEMIGDLTNAGRWIRKYASSGSHVLWTAGYKRGNEDDFGLDLALGREGALFVSGWSYVWDFYRGKNLTVDKINPEDGTLLESFEYQADRGTYETAARDEIGHGIAAWSDSRFVVVGSEDRADMGQGVNWIILSYSLIPGPVPSRDNIRTYPNPFRPSRAVSGTMKFAYLPAGSTVRIYTLGGRQVRELNELGNAAEWNGLDENGREMPTGAYYYLVVIPGEREFKGKFALIRQ